MCTTSDDRLYSYGFLLLVNGRLQLAEDFVVLELVSPQQVTYLPPAWDQWLLVSLPKDRQRGVTETAQVPKRQ